MKTCWPGSKSSGSSAGVRTTSAIDAPVGTQRRHPVVVAPHEGPPEPGAVHPRGDGRGGQDRQVPVQQRNPRTESLHPQRVERADAEHEPEDPVDPQERLVTQTGQQRDREDRREAGEGDDPGEHPPAGVGPQQLGDARGRCGRLRAEYEGDVGHEERRDGGGEATVEPVHAVEAAEQPLDRRDACAEYQVRREGGVPAQPR